MGASFEPARRTLAPGALDSARLDSCERHIHARHARVIGPVLRAEQAFFLFLS
jgi:hypothetical protein